MYAVVLEYSDGREAVVERRILDFGEAIAFALELAERAGHYAGDGHGPPHAVKLFSGDRLEIALSVIAGGLLSRADAPRSRPS